MRAQLEHDVAEVVGPAYAHQARAWQAIGMLNQLYGFDERAALAYIRRRATERELTPAVLADQMVTRHEPPSAVRSEDPGIQVPGAVLGDV